MKTIMDSEHKSPVPPPEPINLGQVILGVITVWLGFPLLLVGIILGCLAACFLDGFRYGFAAYAELYGEGKERIL